MFFVNAAGLNVRFSFRYNHQKRQTSCLLQVNDKNYEGTVTRFAADLPDKDYARKAALKKTIGMAKDDIPFSRDVRSAVWSRYFERHIPNKDWQFIFDSDTEPFATGKLDPEYCSKVGSDDLTNNA